MTVGYVQNLFFIHGIEHLFIVSEFLKAVVRCKPALFLMPHVKHYCVSTLRSCICLLVEVTPFHKEYVE